MAEDVARTVPEAEVQVRTEAAAKALELVAKAAKALLVTFSPIMDEEEFAAPPLVEVPREVVPRRRPGDLCEATRVQGLGDLGITHFVYVDPMTGKPQPHFKCLCKQEGHGISCQKCRGAIPRFERFHGVIEPIAFLHAWHAVPFPTTPAKVRHAQEEPTQEAVSELAWTFRKEFEDMARALGR